MARQAEWLIKAKQLPNTLYSIDAQSFFFLAKKRCLT